MESSVTRPDIFGKQRWPLLYCLDVNIFGIRQNANIINERIKMTLFLSSSGGSSRCPGKRRRRSAAADTVCDINDTSIAEATTIPKTPTNAHPNSIMTRTKIPYWLIISILQLSILSLNTSNAFTVNPSRLQKRFGNRLSTTIYNNDNNIRYQSLLWNSIHNNNNGCNTRIGMNPSSSSSLSSDSSASSVETTTGANTFLLHSELSTSPSSATTVVPWEQVVMPPPPPCIKSMILEMQQLDDWSLVVDEQQQHHNNNNNDDSSTTIQTTTTTIEQGEGALVTAPSNSNSNNNDIYLHPDRVSPTDIAVILLSTISLIGSFMALIWASGVGMWRYYLAGGICAAISHMVPVPIDVIKTRKQINTALADLSFLEVARYIIKKEGPTTLLDGFGPTAIGYLLEGSIKFGVYEVMKPIVQNMCTTLLQTAQPGSHIKLISYLMSAALSGIAASIILCPMEALRIRIVAHSERPPPPPSNGTNNKVKSNRKNGGWVYTGYKLVKHEGISALTKGLIPMLLKQVPYTITKNVSFDYITKYIYTVIRQYGDGIICTRTKLIVPLLSAVVASVLSCITSQPGDMLLSLVNAHSNTAIATTPTTTTTSTAARTTGATDNNNNIVIVQRRRTRDIISDILRSEKGVRGFFVGMKTRLLHVGIIVTLQLIIYDFVKRFCGIAATGI